MVSRGSTVSSRSAKRSHVGLPVASSVNGMQHATRFALLVPMAVAAVNVDEHAEMGEPLAGPVGSPERRFGGAFGELP